MNPPPPFPPYYHPPPPQPFNSLPPPLPMPPPLPAPSPLPPVSHLQSLPETAAPDLSSVRTALSSLLRLTEATLNSLSPYLPTPPPSTLIPCPFNPNHRLPHSSVFSHYLSCPSSFAPISDPQTLLDSLHYRQALQSSPTKSCRQILQNPTAPELSFSLKYFLNIPQNFFYFNCPGAVIADSSKANGSSSPMFKLPGILFAECANFRHDNDFDGKGFLLESVRIFPSEIWAVKNETEGWVDYPSSYSCRLLRCILSLCKSDFSGLMTWVVEHSPRYGVVIDLPMRDYMVLLFKLCLKAIIREAISLLGFISDRREDNEMGLGEKRFDCPVLVKAMMWLGSQLCVLYGEVNGNTFAINMLKHCVLDSALSTSCFPVIEKAKESSDTKELDGKSEGTLGKSGQELRKMMHESVLKSKIFVNQVAASVAALYERSSLEEKIKSLRDPRRLTAYQRVVEHENISKTANQERQKRPDYRPIIEHDGILSKRRENQEPNKIKTKEELLAEERDYKRRRMSYRGKKIKRSTTQVMRDMIDEFMDEIKLASGLDFGKEAERAESTAFAASDVEFAKKQPAPELSMAHPHVHGSSLQYDDGVFIKHSVDKDGEHYGTYEHGSTSHHDNADNDRSSRRERHNRKDSSKSHDRERSSKHLQEPSRNHRKEGDSEVLRESSKGKLRELHEKKSHRREERTRGLGLGHEHSRRKRKDHRSDSVRTEFEDRYDPSSTRYNSEPDAY